MLNKTTERCTKFLAGHAFASLETKHRGHSADGFSISDIFLIWLNFPLWVGFRLNISLWYLFSYFASCFLFLLLLKRTCWHINSFYVSCKVSPETPVDKAPVDKSYNNAWLLAVWIFVPLSIYPHWSSIDNQTHLRELHDNISPLVSSLTTIFFFSSCLRYV